MCGSTCFRHTPPHHQQHTTALGVSGFTVGEKWLEFEYVTDFVKVALTLQNTSTGGYQDYLVGDLVDRIGMSFCKTAISKYVMLSKMFQAKFNGYFPIGRYKQ
jgi:hypothetical protein